MYCPNCGNQIPDGAQSCSYCGSAIVVHAVVPNNTSAMVPPGTMQKKKRSKLPLLLLLVALLAASAFAATHMRGCSLTENNSSPEAVVNKATHAALDLDFDRMLETMAPEVLDYALSAAGYTNKDEAVAYLNESIAGANEQMQLFGLNLQDILKVVEVKTSGVSYYSEDGLESLRDAWNSRIPGFGDSFEDAATVTIEFSGQVEVFGQTISLSDYIGSANEYITTVKIGGQWYVLESDLSGLGSML